MQRLTEDAEAGWRPLYRIGAVKRAETRARKITEFVAMLERGETVHG